MLFVVIWGGLWQSAHITAVVFIQAVTIQAAALIQAVLVRAAALIQAVLVRAAVMMAALAEVQASVPMPDYLSCRSI